jgi:hypothetical protein
MNKKAKIDLGLPQGLSCLLLEANVRGSDTSEIEMKLNECTRLQIISYLQLSLLNLQQLSTANIEGASHCRGVTKDTWPHLRKGHRLDLVDDGTRSRGRGCLTLWVLWNKSALRADLRVFQNVGCRALGCVAPRGPQKHPLAGSWGASHSLGVTKDTRPHLSKGHRLDLVDDGTRSRGRGCSTLWVFWNKSASESFKA